MLPLPGFQRALDITLGIACGSSGTLVIQFFTLAQAQLQLDTPLFKVERKRNQRVTLQLDLLPQAADLAFMGQQTAGTARIFVKDVAVVVGADVHALYDQLAVVNVGPGVFQVGSAGTQLLPQAQLDRFMVRLEMGYPDFASQVNILRDRQTGDPLQAVQTVCSAEELLTMQTQAQQVHMADALLEYVTKLAEASRSHPLVVLGVSPRGALAVCRMCKSRAFMAGRDYVLPDDVTDVFADVCAHRIVLSPKARISETSPSDVLAEVLRQVTRPDHI